MSRLSAALGLVGLVAGVAVVAWLVGRGAATPEDAAAPAPPGPSVLAVPVERRQLEKTVVARGTVEFESPMSIPLEGMEIAARGVVTVGAHPGDQVDEGDVVLEVASRPVFVLSGIRPSYRTLERGMSGPDVVQLQEAMVRAGTDLLEVDGVYGRSTEEALLRFYVEAGYDPPVIGTRSTASETRVADLWSAVAEGGEECRPPDPGGSCPLLDQLVEEYRSTGLEVRVPFGELIYVVELPAVVGSGSPKRGDPLAGAVLNMASTETAVRLSVRRIDAQLVSVGHNVTVEDDVTGVTARGSVVDLRAPEEAGDVAVVQVALDSSGEELVGRSVLARIPIEATAGEVDVVPVAALHSDTGGRIWVELSKENDVTVWLEVTTGLEADGMVEVHPIEGPMPADAWVVVGREDGP